MVDFTMRPASADLSFLIGYLTSHPRATYAEAKEAASEQGHKVSPIQWARARRTLGRFLDEEGAADPLEARAEHSAEVAEALALEPEEPTGAGEPEALASEPEPLDEVLAEAEPVRRRRAARAEPARPAGLELVIRGPEELREWQEVLDWTEAGGRVALEYSDRTWRIVRVD